MTTKNICVFDVALQMFSAILTTSTCTAVHWDSGHNKKSKNPQICKNLILPQLNVIISNINVYIYVYVRIYIYIYIYVYSPGLGPERVRSPTFCFCCNICYVCLTAFTFVWFCCNICYVCLTTFTISAIIIVYCSDNCCLLFKQWAREGGCQGAPGLNHCC